MSSLDFSPSYVINLLNPTHWSWENFTLSNSLRYYWDRVKHLYRERGVAGVGNGISRWWKRSLLKQPQRYLTRVCFDITDRCNARCYYCMKYQNQTIHRSDIAPGLLEKIAQEMFPAVETIELMFASEALVSSQFERALELCNQYGVPDIRITSNGLALSGRTAEIAIEGKMSYISITIDSMDPDRYRQIKGGVSLQKVLDNIVNFNELKQQRGANKPEIVINMTISRRNIEEVESFIEKAASLGIKQVTLAHLMISDESLKDDCLFFYPTLANDYYRRALKMGERLGVKVNVPEFFAETEEERQKALDSFHPNCDMPWVGCAINVQGLVYPCCGFLDEPPFGDLKKESWMEIWHSERFLRLRQGIRGEVPLDKHCYNCPAPMFGSVNHFEAFFMPYQKVCPSIK